MQLSGIPAKFYKAFGSGASPGNIRSIPVTSADPNAASQTVGWPANAFVPAGAGGVPPDGRDMNGLDNMLSAWAQWQAAGGAFPPYDATFQAAVGGYPKTAIVGSVTNPGTFWLCTADNNLTNPDAAGAGWSAFPAASSVNWAAPGAIGSSAPNTGAFSSLTAFAITTTGTINAGVNLEINGVGFAQSFGASGYQKLPTGLIMAWGHLTTPTGNGDVITFPTTFPNNCAISVDVGNDGSGAVFAINGSLSGPPYSSVQVWTFKSGVATAAGMSYVAVGQ